MDTSTSVQKGEGESPLVAHARRELTGAGLFSKESDYDGMLGEAVLDLVKTFASQGHSGFSAMTTLDIFDRVAKFKTLTPVTNDPEEWMDVGNGQHQSRRCPSFFSNDGGQTYYDLDGDKDVSVTAAEKTI